MPSSCRLGRSRSHLVDRVSDRPSRRVRKPLSIWRTEANRLREGDALRQLSRTLSGTPETISKPRPSPAEALRDPRSAAATDRSWLWPTARNPSCACWRGIWSQRSIWGTRAIELAEQLGETRNARPCADQCRRVALSLQRRCSQPTRCSSSAACTSRWTLISRSTWHGHIPCFDGRSATRCIALPMPIPAGGRDHLLRRARSRYRITSISWPGGASRCSTRGIGMRQPSRQARSCEKLRLAPITRIVALSVLGRVRVRQGDPRRRIC